MIFPIVSNRLVSRLVTMPASPQIRAAVVAVIVPYDGRTRWLSGATMRQQRTQRAADPALRAELDDLVGETPADP